MRRRPSPPAPDAFDPLAALTVAALADELGDIDAVVEPLLARRTLLRAEATRRRLMSFVGLRWRIDRDVTSPLVVDLPAIQARMGETWMTAFRKPQLRIGFTAVPHESPEIAP